MKYLGVSIHNDLENLYNCNYGKLYETRPGRKIIPLTLLEKNCTIKLNILPCFLFLFQNLPLHIYHKHPLHLLRKFIWKEKKPKVKTLQQKKDRGGLELPNLINYYNAAQRKAILAKSLKDKFGF